MASKQESCVQNILSKKLSPGQTASKQDLAIAFSECRDKQASMALQNLKVKLATLKIPTIKTRYLTASLDTDFIPDPQKQGHFASYFLLKGDEINGREWGVTSASIPANISTFIGRPLVATSNKFIKDSAYGVQYLHPSITHFMQDLPELVAGLNPMNMDDVLQFQDKFKIGTIDDVFFNSEKNLWNASVRLAEGVEYSDLPPFCSPALYQLDMTEREGNLTKWTGLHLAALDIRPAYGNIALLNGTCSGTSSQCKTQFAGVTNSLKTDMMRIAAMLSTQNRDVDKVVLSKKKNINKKYAQMLYASNFDESEHPRDADGKFTGGGSTGSSKKDEPTQNKSVFDVSSYHDSNGRISISVDKIIPDFENHVGITRSIWNGIDDDFKFGIKNFRIGSAPDGSPDAVGTFDRRTSTVGIHLGNSSLTADSTEKEIKEFISTTMVHEVAHSKYSLMNSDKKKEWTDAVLQIPPITKYLDRFKEPIADAQKEFDRWDGLKQNQFKIIRKNNDILADTKATSLQKAQAQTDINFAQSAIKETRPELEETETRLKQMKDIFANETHSEFQVINQGHNSLFQTDAKSFNTIKPIHDNLFGDKK